jgi:hypothetical protein
VVELEVEKVPVLARVVLEAGLAEVVEAVWLVAAVVVAEVLTGVVQIVVVLVMV